MFLNHIYLIPLFPAIGAAIMFFFGRKLQKSTVSAVCVGAVVLAFIMSCGAVIQYNTWADANHHQPFEKILYTWLGTDTGHLNYVTHDGSLANFQADAGFLLDPLSASGCCSSPASACSSIFIPPDTWRMKAATTASSDTSTSSCSPCSR